MYKSRPKQKHGLIKFKYGVDWWAGALNGGTLSLFFNENKKEPLDFLLKPEPREK